MQIMTDSFIDCSRGVSRIFERGGPISLGSLKKGHQISDGGGVRLGWVGVGVTDEKGGSGPPDAPLRTRLWTGVYTYKQSHTCLPFKQTLNLIALFYRVKPFLLGVRCLQLLFLMSTAGVLNSISVKYLKYDIFMKIVSTVLGLFGNSS